MLNKTMVEKERSMSPQPDNLQHNHLQPEDEVGLLDCLGILVRKKALISSMVVIFTLLSILYIISITPVYRATIILMTPEKSLASFFPEFASKVLPDVYRNTRGVMEEGIQARNYLLNKFLTEFRSYPIQEQVFIEGEFFQRFVASNPNIDTSKGIVQEINRSINGANVNIRANYISSGLTVSLEMEGKNPEVLSDFLNALAERVKIKVVNDVKESIEQGIKTQKDLLSAELEKYRSQERLEKEAKIRHFSENLEIAKNLGILENNFGGPKADIFRSLEEIPFWYLYGQRALEQELKVLERSGMSSQNIKEIAELDYKIAYISKIDLPKINFEPVIIGQYSVSPVHPVNIDKTKVIAFGIALGLFIGILMAFISNAMDQMKKSSEL